MWAEDLAEEMQRALGGRLTPLPKHSIIVASPGRDLSQVRQLYEEEMGGMPAKYSGKECDECKVYGLGIRHIWIDEFVIVDPDQTFTNGVQGFWTPEKSEDNQNGADVSGDDYLALFHDAVRRSEEINCYAKEGNCGSEDDKCGPEIRQCRAKVV